MTLEQLRKNSGLKAIYISKQLGISRRQYRNYELGINKPTLARIDKLARMLGVTFEEIQQILEGKKC